MNPPPSPPRDRGTRLADTLAMLATPGIDTWVATASAEGGPHLVPLSLAWVDERVIVAVPATSVTARNLYEGALARVGVGPTRDVVMIDVVVERVIDVGVYDAPHASYVAQADWEPGDGYVYVVLRPDRVQAWREANEIPGRTLMKHGSWLTPE